MNPTLGSTIPFLLNCSLRLHNVQAPNSSTATDIALDKFCRNREGSGPVESYPRVAGFSSRHPHASGTSQLPLPPISLTPCILLPRTGSYEVHNLRTRRAISSQVANAPLHRLRVPQRSHLPPP